VDSHSKKKDWARLVTIDINWGMGGTKYRKAKVREGKNRMDFEQIISSDIKLIGAWL